MTEHVAVDEEYLLVEEVADRLGLPLSVLMRRVEAGDIPARRIENENGVHYSLRLSDLGIEGAALEPTRGEDAGPYGAAVAYDPGSVAPAHGGDGPHDDHDVPTVDLTGHRVPEAAEDDREPAQPAPPWFRGEETEEGPQAEPDPDDAVDQEPGHAEAEYRGQSDELEQLVVEDVPMPLEASIDEVLIDDGPVDDVSPGEAVAEIDPPVPAAIIAEQRSPHGDLSAMSLDARELVAGLLDRWERTLEQRIYTEQRQRFQGELTARQNMVKQLQMELHTARAEHAAAQAQKDRQLAEKERELADRERDLADARRLADETERLLAPAASARRRRWFWQRDD